MQQGIPWGRIQQVTPWGNLIIEVDPPPPGGGEDVRETEDDYLEGLVLAKERRVSVDEVGIRVLMHMALKGWGGVVDHLAQIAVNPGPNKEMAYQAMKALAHRNVLLAILFMAQKFEREGKPLPAYLWYTKAADFFPDAVRRAAELHSLMRPPPSPPPPPPLPLAQPQQPYEG